MWKNTYTVGLIVPLIIAALYDLSISGIPSPTNPAQAHKAPLGFVPVGNYTQLQDSDGTDILFVHGLGSNPDTTWQARRRTQGLNASDANVNWVSEFLPDDLGQLETGSTRLYFFNFDSFWKRDAAQARLTTIGNDLLEHMANGIRRSPEAKRRKLVLVGYSYGGLVIKKAVVLARGSPDFEYVVENTQAIIFLGTPHRGSTFSSWGRRVAGLLRLVGSNPSILAEIEYDSTMLLDLHMGFEAGIGTETQIVNVFEQRPTLLFRFWFFQWREFCVREQSAKFGGGRVRNIGLPVDHRGLNKFASRDSSYRVLLSILSYAITSGPQKSRRSHDPKDEFRVTLQLPMLRSDRFTGRDDILQHVHRYFKDECTPSQQCVFALHGPGGIGKTQIAVEYAYRYMDRYTSVFWIDGSSEPAILQSFTHAADQVLSRFRETHTNNTEYMKFAALFGGDNVSYDTSPGIEKRARTVRGMFDWLTQQENHQWLLIFDNVDDLDSFDIRNHIPRVPFGSILLTSRRKDISGYWKSIAVGEMAKEEGKSLFSKSSGFYGEVEDTVAQELLHLLGYFPLAIEQAGAYLSAQQNFLPDQPEQFTRAVRKYIEQYHVNAERLLAHRRPLSIWDYRNDTILTTWEVSLNAVQEKTPEAAELLFLCGFLSNNDISEDMLSDDVHLQTSKNSISELFQLLASFSLVRFTSSMNAITIHPLIHYWLRQRLPLQRKQELTHRALVLLARTLRLKHPEGHLGTCDCNTNHLGPHIHAALANARVYLSKAPVLTSIDLPHPLEHLTMSHKLSFLFERPYWWYLWLLGQLQEAGLLFKSVYREEEQLEDDAWLLTYKLTIAIRDYNLPAAAQLFNWELSEVYRKLHPMHPRSLSVAGDLAWVLYRLQHFEESRRWYEWILTARQRVLGHNHYATMGALIGLAALHEAEGNFDKALELRLTAYQSRVARLGPRNLLTQNAAKTVANQYFDLERYEEADKLYRTVLDAEVEIHGLKHKRVLTLVRDYLANFASKSILDKQAEWARIEYQILNATMGPVHQETLDSAERMALIHFELDQHEQVLEWGLRIFDGRNRTLGLYHKDTMDTMHNLGRVSHHLSRLDESLRWDLMAYETRNRTLGQYNERTLGSALNIGATYADQLRFDKALEWSSIAFQGQNRTLGLDHESTLKSAYSIGLAYEGQFQYENALAWYSIAFEGQNRTLGPNDRATLWSAKKVGFIYDRQFRFDEALEFYSMVFQRRNRTLGPDSYLTLESAHDIGVVYHHQSRFGKAIEWYTFAFEGQKRTLGPDAQETPWSAANIAFAYRAQSQFENVLEWHSIAFEGHIIALGPGHEATLWSGLHVGRVHMDLEQYHEALGWFRRVLSLGDESGSLGIGQDLEVLREARKEISKIECWMDSRERCEYEARMEAVKVVLGEEQSIYLESSWMLEAPATTTGS
ncbi:uncharacterized protein APUU_50139S [Aspergillus puulaauensis]|uniref:GPI inositol-deacylase n=1 Tax=Aspergillus puulaauensis TaxID=1220207 RepID=A0A7R7XR50_9EURO|nr:uncharacterized protein APUU_50139S [Aspergillus puulaauensis]BCS25428.1 hypothetical protein APUU_50139S [Aspergillus puulaauensis]